MWVAVKWDINENAAISLAGFPRPFDLANIKSMYFKQEN